MNTSSSPRKFNYPHAVLIAGLVLSLFAIMFRPAGADAGLPSKVNVFSAWDEKDGSSLPLDGVGQVTRDYDVILKNQTKPTKVSLTGVRISEVLEKVGANLDNVQFVKIRYGTDNDSAISLLSLNADSPERPPIILKSGKKPGLGSFATPAIVPGQPTSKPLHEADIVPFKTGSGLPNISIIPGKPGGKILSVTLSKKRTSKGEIKYTPVIKNGTKGAARKIEWFTYTPGSKDAPVSHGNKETYTTDDAVANSTKGAVEHQVSVVVTETLTGSTGAAADSYNARRSSKDQGSTTAPPHTPSTGTPTTTPGNTSTGVNQNGTGSSSTILPPSSNLGTQPTSPTTVPQPSAQTGPTVESSKPTSSEDTSAITNVAQNVSGTGGLHTVTGVLLSTPTAMPISSSGSGTPLSTLPAPVANQLNSIFKPVDSTDDVWAYLLAILFAFSISGAVREWVNP